MAAINSSEYASPRTPEHCSPPESPLQEISPPEPPPVTRQAFFEQFSDALSTEEVDIMAVAAAYGDLIDEDFLTELGFSTATDARPMAGEINFGGPIQCDLPTLFEDKAGTMPAIDWREPKRSSPALLGPERKHIRPTALCPRGTAELLEVGKVRGFPVYKTGRGPYEATYARPGSKRARSAE